MNNYDKLYKEAEMVAILAHKGQIYDIFPYEKHLVDVVDVLKRFGYSGDYILAGWLHNTIEDGNLTYNKIKKAFGTHVAEMVLAVTDPSDVRSRKEKKTRVYQKLNNCQDAIVVKLADRIANIENSIRMGNQDKYEMYYLEYKDFKKALKKGNNPDIEKMWAQLDNLFEMEKSFD